MNIEELHNQLATVAIEFHDGIRKVVQDIPDAELPLLVQECRKLAEPTSDRSFPMPEWNIIASIIDTEHRNRLLHEEARAYMEKTGATVYCPKCNGACTPEHLAELD